MRTNVCIFFAALAVASGPNLAEAQWKAGFAVVKITPETPRPMAGYASRTTPLNKVEQDIYAKALAVQDEQGHQAILITTALLGLSRAIAEPVCERIQASAQLARSQILLNSAHTDRTSK